MSKNVAVVGATGAVGRMMLKVLEERRFPLGALRVFASAKSAGTTLPFAGGTVTVESANDADYRGIDVALFSAGGSASLELAPRVAAAGAVVIDNSSAWRMHPEVPLVVPEVNPEAIAQRPKGIIANPNCSTIQMLVAIAPLHREVKITRIVVSTYQAASGKGQAAVEDLLQQAGQILRGEAPTPTVFPAPLAFNVLSDWKAGEGDYSEEEWKMVHETRKILGDPSVGVSPTCVRVPVVHGHSESVNLEFERPLSAARAKEILAQAKGVVLVPEAYAPGQAPLPQAVAGRDEVFVGRVREDPSRPGALNLFVVADNLRKGAATNAVQIAELL